MVTMDHPTMVTMVTKTKVMVLMDPMDTTITTTNIIPKMASSDPVFCLASKSAKVSVSYYIKRN